MKKEYSGVDLFKLLAAIGVIAIHTDMPILRIISRLAVPFFAIISSMFFVQINHTGKGFLFLIFREIKLRKYSSLH
ncbi:hypothetical protein EFR95_07140, partial [Lactobacillus amylovorus]|uniref:hypothetical protein n=1 Tax=Lactobacillus amylovorus TaxID=1604 RepID=UPI0021A58CD9